MANNEKEVLNSCQDQIASDDANEETNSWAEAAREAYTVRDTAGFETFSLESGEMSSKEAAHPALAAITRLFEKGEGFIVASTLEGESTVFKSGKVDTAATRANLIAALRVMQEINEERRGKDPSIPKLQLQYFQNKKEVDGTKIEASKLAEFDISLTRLVGGKPDGVVTLVKKDAEFDYGISREEEREMLRALAPQAAEGKRFTRAQLAAKLAEIKKPYVEAQKIWDALNSKSRPELRDLLVANLTKMKEPELKQIDRAFREMFGMSTVDFVEKTTTKDSNYQKQLLNLLNPLRKPRK